jgi:aryl-alcohol dehydrogenase-like predicted oxidoreductase
MCRAVQAHQAYYSLVGRSFEWERMLLGLDQKVGTIVWSPLGWGRLTGRIRRGQPAPEVSRLKTPEVLDRGPPLEDEHVFRVVDALDAASRQTPAYPYWHQNGFERNPFPVRI